MSALSLVLQAGPVAKAVLLLLLVFSLACWTIIFLKLGALRKADRQDERFLRLFRDSKNLAQAYEECRRYPQSPLAALFREGYRELAAGLRGGAPVAGGNPTGPPDAARAPELSVDTLLVRLSRMLRYASLREVAVLEKSIIFLATTGNVAPFIGLFGTVWGIMDAFHSIGLTGSTNLGAVAPGVAEALVATAAGIAVAIPGVVGYNYFLNRIKGAATRMDIFALEFLGLAERLALKAGRG